MSLPFDTWIRYYIDSECHFFQTAMDFFEDYNHTADPYQQRRSGSGFLYESDIYLDFTARVERSQGCMSSLIHGKVDLNLFLPVFLPTATEHHLFALSFACLWNMTEAQKSALSSVCVSADWRISWNALNYFLCKPKEDKLPPESELRAFRYRGAYLRRAKGGSPDNGVWVQITEPEKIFL